jgi:Uma2 family endonuclease
MSIASPELMTAEQLLALPDNDGIERELVRGVLRERPVTRRNRRHSRATTRIAKLLEAWLERQPEPRGEVLTGEAGFRIRRNPDTTVGIDVAYISAETARANPEDTFLIEGVPVLAVEILSPSDTQEDILDKVDGYLDAGVALVWVVEPKYRTVSVYRPGVEPTLFNATQELTGEPHLPGFRAAVSDLFGA